MLTAREITLTHASSWAWFDREEVRLLASERTLMMGLETFLWLFGYDIPSVYWFEDEVIPCAH